MNLLEYREIVILEKKQDGQQISDLNIKARLLTAHKINCWFFIPESSSSRKNFILAERTQFVLPQLKPVRETLCATLTLEEQFNNLMQQTKKSTKTKNNSIL